MHYAYKYTVKLLHGCLVLCFCITVFQTPCYFSMQSFIWKCAMRLDRERQDHRQQNKKTVLLNRWVVSLNQVLQELCSRCISCAVFFCLSPFSVGLSKYNTRKRDSLSTCWIITFSWKRQQKAFRLRPKTVFFPCFSLSCCTAPLKIDTMSVILTRMSSKGR